MREINILSFGGGIQTSAIYLMSYKGILPKYDYVIFADTGWEQQLIYDNIILLQEITNIPIIIISNGNIYGDIFSYDYSLIPVFSNKGRFRRICTRQYKLDPINQYVRKKILKLKSHARMPHDIYINMALGITIDEAHRMKQNLYSKFRNVYPLIEMNWTRNDCIEWLNKNFPNIKFIKSACCGCPFHSDGEWKNLKKDKIEWRKIILADQKLNKKSNYLHPSLRPIDEVDFTKGGQGSLFGNECFGICET